MLEIYARAGFPYMDLIQLGEAQRVVIADRQDRGDLTAGEAVAEIEALSARINSDFFSRQGVDQTNQHMRAMQQQQMLQSFQPPRPLTCTRIGASTVCQ